MINFRLEKIIKKAEKKNKKSKEQSTFKFISSNKKSEKEIIRYNSAKVLKKNNNQFMFSEKAKNLMTNDGRSTIYIYCFKIWTFSMSSIILPH